MEPEYVPTPDDIRAETKQIRAEWSEDERIRRRVSIAADITDQADGYFLPPLQTNQEGINDEELW